MLKLDARDRRTESCRPPSVACLPAVCVMLALTLLAPAGLAQGVRGGGSTHLESSSLATGVSIPRIQLYHDLGSHGYAISTKSPLAQRYFDQGLRLAWVLEYDAAQRSFAEAERLDPRCAMCAWGVAWTLASLDADDQSSDALAVAREALRRATARVRRLSPRERGLITALSTRLTRDSERYAALSSYASSLAQLSAEFPDDDQIRLLRAQALWQLSSRPEAGVKDRKSPAAELASREVELVQLRAPTHPGACMLASTLYTRSEPARVLSCITRLKASMPRVLRLAQLQSELYTRLGRYADAIAASEHALTRLRQGEAHFDRGVGISMFTRSAQAPQSLARELTFAATMSGQREVAMRSARETARIATSVFSSSSESESALALPLLTLVTFGDWNAVLREPLPGSTTPLARMLAMYARGVALAAKQRWHEAEVTLRAVRGFATRARTTEEHQKAQLAAHLLSGEIALRRSQPVAAADFFRRAVAIEDELATHETTRWYYPTRHSLGLALLAAGRARESVDVYEADLRRHPENGWALIGLAHALGAQGNRNEARRAHARFAVAFAAADVSVPGSRF